MNDAKLLGNKGLDEETTGLVRVDCYDLPVAVESTLYRQVVLRYTGSDTVAPRLKARLIRAMRGAYLIRDRLGRHWAASRLKWSVEGTEEAQGVKS